MARFSERVGAVRPREDLLLEAIDEDLRVAIWNLLTQSLGREYSLPGWVQVTQLVGAAILNLPIDRLPDQHQEAALWWKEQIFKRVWYEVYDLLEFAVQRFPMYPTCVVSSSDRFIEIANRVLEKHGSGYRFVAGQLAPITSETEISAVEEAISGAQAAGLDAVRLHLEAAIEKLSQKPDPDCRNSIKEAISAVESAASRLAGHDKAELDEALRILRERGVSLHGALEKSFKSLYGYTSDADGIRHAALELPDVGYDEAKFFLVACSAFVHFLIMKAEAAGLLAPRS
jgi:hypothetical protein